MVWMVLVFSQIIIIIVIIIIYSLRIFNISVFHCSLSDSKSPQVSRNLFSILPVLNNVVVWIVSARPLIPKSSSPLNNHLVTVPRALITICIIVTFMFHNFLNFLARSKYLSFFSLSFNFILWSLGTRKSTILQVLFFLLIIIILVFCPKLIDLCVGQNHIGVYVCDSPRQMLGYAYTICSYAQI